MLVAIATAASFTAALATALAVAIAAAVVAALVVTVARRLVERERLHFERTLDQLLDIGELLALVRADSDSASPVAPARPVRPIRCT